MATNYDKLFVVNANELFDAAEEIFNSVKWPTPPAAPVPPTPPAVPVQETSELQQKYDALKSYVTKVEAEQLKLREELRRSHEVLADFQKKLEAKNLWMNNVKNALLRTGTLLNSLAEKM